MLKLSYSAFRRSIILFGKAYFFSSASVILNVFTNHHSKSIATRMSDFSVLICDMVFLISLRLFPDTSSGERKILHVSGISLNISSHQSIMPYLSNFAFKSCAALLEYMLVHIVSLISFCVDNSLTLNTEFSQECSELTSSCFDFVYAHVQRATETSKAVAETNFFVFGILNFFTFSGSCLCDSMIFFS